MLSNNFFFKKNILSNYFFIKNIKFVLNFNNNMVDLEKDGLILDIYYLLWKKDEALKKSFKYF